MPANRPGDRHLRPPVSLRIPPELVEQLDQARGDQPRNAFIVEAIRREVARRGDPR